MKFFSAQSHLLADGKWQPGGTIITIDGDTENVQESEFGPEHRFETKEEADQFFADYYRKMGYMDRKKV